MKQLVRCGVLRPLRGARMLVVEDDFPLLMELRAILREAGAETVVGCGTVDQAVAIADGDGVAAAVLDVRLGRETSLQSPDSWPGAAHRSSSTRARTRTIRNWRNGWDVASSPSRLALTSSSPLSPRR